MLTPTPEQVMRMVEIGLARAPAEACGIFTVAGLHELPNTAEDPRDGYLIDLSDLVAKLSYEFGQSCGWDDFVIWHTHPSGHIGPSSRDIENKIDGLNYFVVALPNGEGAMF